MSTPALTVSAARKQFGGLVAVNDVDFEVRDGELLGLIGPNGSGKTTMLNLISGALKPTSGEIRLGNDRISGKAPHEIAQKGVARTFQLVRVLPSMSAERNVMAGAVFGHARLWGDEARDVARDLLARVGLEDRAPSAGRGPDLYRPEADRTRPRAGLQSEAAAASTSGWPASTRASSKIGIALIEEVGREGRTIIMVEHVMDAIRALCDRCVVMNTGHKIAEGEVKAVLSDPEVMRAYLGDDDDA